MFPHPSLTQQTTVGAKTITTIPDGSTAPLMGEVVDAAVPNNGDEERKLIAEYEAKQSVMQSTIAALEEKLAKVYFILITMTRKTLTLNVFMLFCKVIRLMLSALINPSTYLIKYLPLNSTKEICKLRLKEMNCSSASYWRQWRLLIFVRNLNADNCHEVYHTKSRSFVLSSIHFNHGCVCVRVRVYF